MLSQYGTGFTVDHISVHYLAHRGHERSGLRLRKDRGGRLEFLCISHAPHEATTQGFIARGVRASQFANEGATIVQAQGTREPLLSAGFRTLDAQTNALGLACSTTWTILTGSHKASGLSASTINRNLAALQLPPLTRSKIREYFEEKPPSTRRTSRRNRQRRAAGNGSDRLVPLAVAAELGGKKSAIL
jgi:hypothetical protein